MYADFLYPVEMLHAFPVLSCSMAQQPDLLCCWASAEACAALRDFVQPQGCCMNGTPVAGTHDADSDYVVAERPSSFLDRHASCTHC